MDLGHSLLNLVDVDGSGWTVVGISNLWGHETSLDVNQPCIGSRSTAMGDGEHASTFNMPELWDRLQVADCND